MTEDSMLYQSQCTTDVINEQIHKYEKEERSALRLGPLKGIPHASFTKAKRQRK